jgi:hypothetical protein
MQRKHNPPLLFLWHPGTRDIFSGYGLAIAPLHLIGLMMVDRPRTADPMWLAEIQQTFGSYELVPMTQGGEQGIICKMQVDPPSRPYVRSMARPLSAAIRTALVPLLRSPPAVTLAVAWDPTQGCWVSTIVRPHRPRFPLGRLVATPGALQALADAGQDPMTFVRRHQAGDWGEVPEEDQQENEFSVTHGFRILSAYRTTRGVRIWVITEADRSASTILLPEE